MKGHPERKYFEWSNAELEDEIDRLKARRATTGGHRKQQRITEIIEELQSVIDHREHDSVASGYADYLEGIYGEDR